jgi:staphyloferrin B biosynthesis citrate synthase
MQPDRPNRVKEQYLQGKPSFGAMPAIQSSSSVEVAGMAGFDFVRLDPYHHNINPETLGDMIRTAYAWNMTPWVRCRNDPWVIMTTLDMGAQIITLPNIQSVEEARAAVNAALYPPKGERENSRALRFRGMSAADYSSTRGRRCSWPATSRARAALRTSRKS